MADGGDSPDGLHEKIKTKTFWLTCVPDTELSGQLVIQNFPGTMCNICSLRKFVLHR